MLDVENNNVFCFIVLFIELLKGICLCDNTDLGPLY